NVSSIQNESSLRERLRDLPIFHPSTASIELIGSNHLSEQPVIHPLETYTFANAGPLRGTNREQLPWSMVSLQISWNRLVLGLQIRSSGPRAETSADPSRHLPIAQATGKRASSLLVTENPGCLIRLE